MDVMNELIRPPSRLEAVVLRGTEDRRPGVRDSLSRFHAGNPSTKITVRVEIRRQAA